MGLNLKVHQNPIMYQGNVLVSTLIVPLMRGAGVFGSREIPIEKHSHYGAARNVPFSSLPSDSHYALTYIAPTSKHSLVYVLAQGVCVLPLWIVHSYLEHFM